MAKHKILAVETSTQACSAALLEGDRDDYSCLERFEIAPRQHTRLILPMLDALLSESGYSLEQMDIVAFGRGPGAFTGVRIATGVVQAIAYGAQLPVAQVSSLAAVAQGAYRLELFEHVLVANDARMDEIYFGAYTLEDGFMMPCGGERVIKPVGLEASLDDKILGRRWCGAGNAWMVYEATLCELKAKLIANDYADIYPHAQDVAVLALNEMERGRLVESQYVAPVYLRENVAKKSVKRS